MAEDPLKREALDIGGGFVSNVAAYALRGRSSKCINWMSDEQRSSIGRPGYRAFSTPAAALLVVGGDPRILALYPFGDVMVAVDGNRAVFSIDAAGVATDITGVRVPGSAVPTFVEDDNGALLIIGGGSPIQWRGPGTRTSTFGEAMPQATHGCVVQRYLVLNDAGKDKIHFSNPVNHTEFDTNNANPSSPAGYFTAETKSDPCLALLEQWNLVWAFGPKSIDAYYPTGSTDDEEGAFRLAWSSPRGVAGVRSMCRADGTLYFLGEDRKAYLLDQQSQPQVLSLEIEPTLLALPRVDDCICHHVQIAGRHLIAFVFPAGRTTLLYDYVLSQGGQGAVWYEWREWSAAAGWLPMAMLAYAYHPRWNKHFVTPHTGGAAVYELAANAYTDNGNRIRRVRRLAPIDHGTGLTKFSFRYRARAQRGVATTAEETADGGDPKLMVRTREVGEQWKEERPMALGRVGKGGAMKMQLSRNGKYRLREMELICDEPVPVHVSSLEEEFEFGEA